MVPSVTGYPRCCGELDAEREASGEWGAWGDGERWAICGCVGGGIWGA